MTIQDREVKLSIIDEIRGVLRDALELGERADHLDASSSLLGSLPELDSMAVVTVVLSLEEKFHITIDGDEIDAETFETVGTLAEFIREKTSR